jgi:hypothetical protein
MSELVPVRALLARGDDLRYWLHVAAGTLRAEEETDAWTLGKRIFCEKAEAAIAAWDAEAAGQVIDAGGRERCLAALRAIGEFAAAHHDQQEPHLWLHALLVDIPSMVETALEEV